MDLSVSQNAVLTYIKDHICDIGIPPTSAEIAKAMGYKSATAAVDILKLLERQGAIKRIPKTARGIVVLI